ncbi:MAG: FtsX-like permease family protein [Acidimicrobiia bacterium]|nr:FtsX-like permease family protein [Acidimicrobiia bacterium]
MTSHLRRGLLRLLAFLRPGRADRELDRELAAHLSLLAAEYQRNGMSAEEAAQAARRAQGGIEQAKELHREARSIAWLEDLRRDVRYAFRTLARTPGFTALAVVTLAIGIGASTAVFGLANAMFLGHIPGVRDSATLVAIHAESSETPDTDYNGFSYAQFLELGERQQGLEDLTAYTRIPGTYSLPDRSGATGLEFVVGNYFRVLGVQSVVGRMLAPADDRPGTPPVAVLSHQAWGQVFGRDPDVVGTTVAINGTPVTIVGIAPAGFNGTRLDWINNPGFWLPAQSYPQIFSQELPENSRLVRPGTDFWLLGRLKTGVTLDAVGSQVDVIARQFTSPRAPKPFFRPDGASADRLSFSRLWPGRHPEMQRLLGMLFGVAMLVLLIGCFAIANFLVGRGLRRRQELSVRLAVGATRGRIVRQLLTESVVLALIAALLGLLVAVGFSRLTGSLPDLGQRVTLAVGPILQPRTFGFALAAALIAVLGTGLMPALFVSGRVRPTSISTSEGTWPTRRWWYAPRQILLAAQVALTVVGAGTALLYAHSLQQMNRVSPGYATEGLAVVRLDLNALGPDRTAALQSRLSEQVSRIPGVEDGAITLNELFAIGSMPYEVPGQGTRDDWVGASFISADYLDLLGLAPRSGRGLRTDDAAAGTAVLVNEEFAARHWPEGDAVGRSLRFPSLVGPAQGWGGLSDRAIVGVIPLNRCRDLLRPPHPCVWLPLGPAPVATLVLRASVPASQTAQPLRRLVDEIDPDAVITKVESFESYVGTLNAQPRIAALSTGAVASVGVVLAVISCIAVLAAMVRSAGRELAIRRALGAPSYRLVASVVLRGLLPSLAGVLVGLGLARGAGSLIADQLYEPGSYETLSVTLAAIAVLTATIVASFWPAAAATRVQPTAHLRAD